MKTRLKKTSLVALPLASLLWLVPNVSAHDRDHRDYRGAHREWRELDARHRDLNDEYQQRLQALDRRRQNAYRDGTADENPEFHRQLKRDYKEARQTLRKQHRDADRDFNRDYREENAEHRHYGHDHDD